MRSQKEWETETEDDAVGIDVQLMGPTGTKYVSCDFEASRVLRNMGQHTYVYLCRCWFSSYRLHTVQKHAKTCVTTDNTAYRADGESLHDWKVSCGCYFEERPRLRPTSSLQQRLGKRRDTEGEGYREHKAILDIKAMERRISEANKPTANDLQRYIDAIDT